MRPAKLKMMLKVLAIQSCNLMSAQRDDSRMSPQPSFFMAVINRVEQSQTAQRYRLTLSFPPSHWQIDGVAIKGDHDDEREPLWVCRGLIWPAGPQLGYQKPTNKEIEIFQEDWKCAAINFTSAWEVKNIWNDKWKESFKLSLHTAKRELKIYAEMFFMEGRGKLESFTIKRTIVCVISAFDSLKARSAYVLRAYIVRRFTLHRVCS